MTDLIVHQDLRFGEMNHEGLYKITNWLAKQGYMNDAICLISIENYYKLTNESESMRGYSSRIDSPGLTKEMIYSASGTLRIGHSLAISNEEVHILIRDKYFIFTDKAIQFNNDMKEVLV